LKKRNICQQSFFVMPNVIIIEKMENGMEVKTTQSGLIVRCWISTRSSTGITNGWALWLEHSTCKENEQDKQWLTGVPKNRVDNNRTRHKQGKDKHACLKLHCS